MKKFHGTKHRRQVIFFLRWNVKLFVVKILFQILFYIVMNQIIVTILFSKCTLMIVENILKTDLVKHTKPDDNPSFSILMLELCCCNILLEITSFYSHRLMHMRFFYRNFHKIHHEFTVPLPMASIYNHPFEHIVMNLMPVFIGIVITRAHFPSVFIWMLINLICAVSDHANVHLPLLKSPRFHNYHHESFVGNYGITGLMDFLYGTDKHFRESNSYEHHSVIIPFLSSRLPSFYSSVSRKEMSKWSRRKSSGFRSNTANLNHNSKYIKTPTVVKLNKY